jgi:predicted MPP superfamily phosphohydrolase
LVVSGGVGCSIAPVRFGVTPEITLVHLEARA